MGIFFRAGRPIDMRKLHSFLLVVSVFFGLNVSAGISTDPAKVDPLSVGSSIPAVVVQDAKGKTHDLARLAGNQPAVIVFYRGGWCPYCSRHLAELAGIEDELKTLGFQILAISPDKPEELAMSADKGEFSYTLLSDSSAKAIRAFGLAFEVDAQTLELYKGYGIDLEAASGESHHLLPVPAVYLSDEQGIVRFRYFNPDYKVRLSPEDILNAARKHAPQPMD